MTRADHILLGCGLWILGWFLIWVNIRVNEKLEEKGYGEFLRFLFFFHIGVPALGSFVGCVASILMAFTEVKR